MIRLPLLIAGVLAIINILSIVDVLAIIDVVDIVAIEVVVDVNVPIHVYVRVVTPAPATAVSPVAVIRDNRARSHAKAETHRRARHRIIRWVNISRIRYRITRINHRRIILRNINDIRLRRLNLNHLVRHNHSLVFNVVRDDSVGHIHDLLVRGLECATLLGLSPHPLNGIRDPLRLVDKRIAKIAGPLDVVVHLIDDLRKPRDRFDIVVPWLRIELRDVVRVLDEPRRLHDFQRISRRRQHRRKQWVWINRDWRDQFVQVRITLLWRR